MWEERYGADDYAYGTDPNSFLKDNVALLPVGEVLCLAEGEGRNSVFLATTGRKVSSVDLSEAGVAKALRLAAARGVVVDAVIRCRVNEVTRNRMARSIDTPMRIASSSKPRGGLRWDVDGTTTPCSLR